MLTPRLEQQLVATETAAAHAAGRNTITQAGTGSGKTVVSVLQAQAILALPSNEDKTVIIAVPTRDKVFATATTAAALNIEVHPYPSKSRILCIKDYPTATTLETACIDSPQCVAPDGVAGHVVTSGKSKACSPDCQVNRKYSTGIVIMTQAMHAVLSRHTQVLTGVAALIIDEGHSWFRSSFEAEGPTALISSEVLPHSPMTDLYLGTSPSDKLLSVYAARIRKSLKLTDEQRDLDLTKDELRDFYTHPSAHWFASYLNATASWRVHTVRYSSPLKLIQDETTTLHLLTATAHDTMRHHLKTHDTSSLTGIPKANRTTVRVNPTTALTISDSLLATLSAIRSTDGGGTLVLFTARKAMLDFAERFATIYPNTLVQSEIMTAGQIARTLNDDKGVSRYIAFGLDSLAEGLDIPGNALTDVVIASTSLPTPTTSIGMWLHHLYKTQALERAAGKPVSNDSSWWSSSTAIDLYTTRLRQSAGRLLRTQEDRGRVWVILDPAKPKLNQPLLRFMHTENNATAWAV